MKFHIFHDWSKWEFVRHLNISYYLWEDNGNPDWTKRYMVFSHQCSICGLVKEKKVRAWK